MFRVRVHHMNIITYNIEQIEKNAPLLEAINSCTYVTRFKYGF